jgi:transmembrane sensor
MKSIITKYLRGKSSTDEQNELLRWIRKDEHLSEFQQMKEEWKAEVVKEAVPSEFIGDWRTIQNRMMEQLQKDVQRKQHTLSFFRYAAIFVVLIAVPALVYILSSNRQNNQLVYTTVAADYGQISKVVLPDSTVIWVNSGSTIKYNNQFSASNRDIELIGEAFFKVHKNKDLPLVVANEDLRVKVLGTEFSVMAYPEEKSIQVVLEKGKVELSSTSISSLKQEMKPNELASYNKENKKLAIEEVNTDLYTSWKDGIINIYDLPLSELVIKLEKRFNQKFAVDEEIKNIPYTFTIKNDDLNSILSLMEKITPVDVVQQGNMIELRYKKTKIGLK